MTVEGRLVAEPELKFTTAGMPICNFRIVAADRKKDPATDQWVDDRTLWISVAAFKTLAENCAESLEKGDLVIVVGKLSTRDYETSTGEKRSSTEIAADSVGVALQFRSVPHGAGKAERSKAAPVDDPWATPATPAEPPF